MALTILTAPGNTYSVSNEMLFIINESTKANDPVTYPNYFYILDIYIDGNIVSRLRVPPDPTHKFGKFDVSVVLRNYVPAYGLKATYANDTEQYDITLAYTCELGEEYNGTLYTNLVTDVERTAYRTYATRPFLSSNIIGNIVNGFASNMPFTMTGYKDEKWKIVPAFSNVSGVDFEYSVIGSDGSLIADDFIVYQGQNNINQFNVGFQKVSSELSLPQHDIDDASKITFSLDALGSYVVNLTCTKHQIYTLAWLNPYGAYESQSFALVSKKKNEITRKEFAQLPYQINASGEVSYDSNGVMYGSKKGYAASVKVSLSLTSHLLTENEYTWLADMFNSPDVYIFLEDIDRFVPVTILENNYEYRNYSNSRLTPLQFNVQFTDIYNSQFL